MTSTDSCKSPALLAEQERRFAQLHMRVEVLLSLLADGARWRVAEHGLPADAELVHWRLHDDESLVLVLRSASFDLLEPDDPIPQLQSTRLEAEFGRP